MSERHSGTFPPRLTKNMTSLPGDVQPGKLPLEGIDSYQRVPRYHINEKQTKTKTEMKSE